jgi:hypothetical protein
MLGGLDLEAVFRARAVPFPDAEDAGACYTQIATRTRPIPMRFGVLRLEFPPHMVEEAGGRTAYFAYERLGRNGYLLRVARCVIPDSPEAVALLLDRFRLPEGSVGLDEFMGHLPVPLVRTDADAVDRWPGPMQPEVGMLRLGGAPFGVAGLPSPTSGQLEIIARLSGESCPRDVTANIGVELDFLGGGDGEGCQCEAQWEGNHATITCCENPHHVIEDGFCFCANGSTHGDCWVDDDDPPPCDPSFELCDDPGEPPPGGGGGGSNPTPEPETCGDDRDTIIAEYYSFGAPNPPSCSDFQSSGGSEYFSWAELNGGFSTGNPHSPWGIVTLELSSGLDMTRAAYGKPIIVNSGYRCPHGNNNVGSAPTSQHVQGLAADIRPTSANMSVQELILLEELAEEHGMATFTLGYPTYANHVHVDWR